MYNMNCVFAYIFSIKYASNNRKIDKNEINNTHYGVGILVTCTKLISNVTYVSTNNVL